VEARAATRDVSREVLVFALGGEEYAVDILKVQEIRGYEKVTAIPGSPAYLKGVVNLRGIIVPVIDMRIKFGLADARYDSFTVVIILRVAGRVIGIVVDAVSDVIRLSPSEVKPAPALGSIVDSGFLAGLATQGERMILLLEIEKFLSSGELNLVASVADAGRETP
jgi:purine-binding chemotaxis protein CheW